MTGAVFAACAAAAFPSGLGFEATDGLLYAAVEPVSGDTVAADLTSDGHAGETFMMRDPVGCVFEFRINGDGETATLVKGISGGADIVRIPARFTASGTEFAVTAIGDFAFKTHGAGQDGPLKGVKMIMIKDGVRSIGQNCFENAPDLVEALVPPSVENISYLMFAGCRKLESVHLHAASKIKTIGSFAFENCVSLREFRIPAEVEEIGDAPWRGCTSLEALAMSDDNYNFVLEDGVLYNGWGNRLIQYPAGRKAPDYNVMYGTETIGNSAFYGSPYIESVWFPASLDRIEHLAFSGCRSLDGVTFNNTIRFIGNMAFTGCPKLKYITLYGNPRYTCEPGDSYNTFDDKTKVTVKKDLPEIKLTASPGGILTSVRDYVAAMPSFQTEEIDSNQKYGFPEEFGKGKVTLYGNAGPKKDVLRVLENIPADMIAYENIDDKGRITRFYFDRDKKTPRVLFFKGGINGNDLVVALFEVSDFVKTEEWLRSLKYEN